MDRLEHSWIPARRPSRVVAIGGGHGLSATLRAVRTYTDAVTAVVSDADDGGRRGACALRATPRAGDLRKCLTALARSGVRRWRGRWSTASRRRNAGPRVRQLLIVAMAETDGNLVAALDQIGAPARHRRSGAARHHRGGPPARQCRQR